MSFGVALSAFLPSTMLAALAGVYVGHRIRHRLDDDTRSQLVTMQTSLLGLLALLLGFFFAMADSRFDLRRKLVLDEANAIGTARLRTELIDDDRARAVARLLDEYVAVRLRGYGSDEAVLRAAIADSERLHREMWSQVTSLAREQPQSLPVSLLVQALNEVIDLHGMRVAAGHNRIPIVVFLMLLAVAIVALGWVGAALGTSGRWGTGPVVVAALVSLVAAVIVDLDAPRSGLIRVNQAPLVELQRVYK